MDREQRAINRPATSSIVTGEIAEKNLPDRLRHTLSSESGLNEGMAHPPGHACPNVLIGSNLERSRHMVSRGDAPASRQCHRFLNTDGLLRGQAFALERAEKTRERTSFLAET